MNASTRSVIEVIAAIPRGRVCTYGRIAMMAGQPTGARQVARILHTMSRTHRLPWHRVVNAGGRISLPAGNGRELQKSLLLAEGVRFDAADRIELGRYLWMMDGTEPSDPALQARRSNLPL